MTRPDAAFRNIPFMGVIHVVAEAEKKGFTNGDPTWCNLGQGQPEVGPISGAPPRLEAAQWAVADHAYGPVVGTLALRQAVADHYNRLFRGGHASKYGPENVAIAAGGRLALSRLIACLANIRLGYQTPDYTAYEDMLACHAHRVTPIRVATDVADGFRVSAERFAQIVEKEQLRAYLVSNPCNPTGQMIEGAELAAYVEVARRSGCVLLLDEFYSHFIYSPAGSPAEHPVSAAAHVKDVNRDPVILIDGLTKNFRYPGWRVGWLVGPVEMIAQVGRAASSIDGGPPTTVQRASLEVLSPSRADQETRAVRVTFARKRKLMLEMLEQLGVRVPHPPRATFYVWGDISGLPAPFNDAEQFFRAALEHQVMIVPGRFFDINPNTHRPADETYRHWVRFSFGPPEDNVRLGLSRLLKLVKGDQAPP